MLFVHDLASGYVLWARPCQRKDAATVAQALRALTEKHGAPLVVRIDNGKALHAKEVRAVIDPLGVTLLRTPIRHPRYNGSCESGLGWHKRRLLDVAERDGGIGVWTEAEFETMRVRANDARRPWGANGPSPAQRFEARTAIAPEDRSAFLDAVASHRVDERLRRDPLCEGRHRAAVERAAIRRTLVDLGHLEINPRRVSTAFFPPTLASNS
jgi:transposase InsO family protein